MRRIVSLNLNIDVNFGHLTDWLLA